MKNSKFYSGFAALLLAFCTVGVGQETPDGKQPTLWSQPTDIKQRDLFYGQGGRAHAPTGAPFQFVEEDLDGKSPKFVVKDRNGVQWKVKIGPEARPETVVTRLVWAVGYTTDEDYFVPTQEVLGMPAKLKRGADFVDSDGVVHDARWERMTDTKMGSWKWKKNPFTDTRELNGLRVMMALVNNWDMKDAQNAVHNKPGENKHVVADLGATLGPTRSQWPLPTGKGDVEKFNDSDFIKKVKKDSVDFAAPSWPMLFGVLPLPPLPYETMMMPFNYVGMPKIANPINQRWIGKSVPVDDVRWMAGLLKQLSPEQISDAFRAGGFPLEVAREFTTAIQRRITALNAI